MKSKLDNTEMVVIIPEEDLPTLKAACSLVHNNGAVYIDNRKQIAGNLIACKILIKTCQDMFQVGRNFEALIWSTFTESEAPQPREPWQISEEENRKFREEFHRRLHPRGR